MAAKKKSPKCTIKKCGMNKTEANKAAKEYRADGFRARVMKKKDGNSFCVATCGKRKKT